MQLVKLFGIVPLGIGLSVWGFLWFSPWNDFHSPPLFFRVFGSFIALPFVLIGLGILFGKLADPSASLKAMQSDLQKSGEAGSLPPNQFKPSGPLKCPNCGSSPGTAEVSPHGDVKCDHCSRWYNVHTV